MIRTRPRLAVAALSLLTLIVAGCGGGGHHAKRAQPPPVVLPGVGHGAGANPQGNRPNIVFVLTDDLSWNLVRYMPHVEAMQRHGVTFSQYFVTDSLCCPSRSSIFTGRYPHDTGIFQNAGPDGGFAMFHNRGEESQTFATALQTAGYQTGILGKYLNGYHPADKLGESRPYVAPFWSEWDVAGEAYPEFNYHLNENGHVRKYHQHARDYLTDVIARRGLAFIRRSAAAREPFMIELATFAPHAPYTPAPRNARDFPGLGVPRTPAFNAANTKPPSWLANHVPLGPIRTRVLNRWFRKRAQSVEAVDRMIGLIERTLARTGQSRNTYLVFSSDNGYHMGDHRLLAGKLTAFDTDIRVPLIVTGPHVPAGKFVDKLTENVDLYPTFARLAGSRVPDLVEGRSLVPFLRGRSVRDWRRAVLIEHHGPDVQAADPDFPNVDSANPTSYEALRMPHALYVEYVNGEREYYDLTRDPYELNNTFDALRPLRRLQLRAMLGALEACHDAITCWRAASHIP